MKNISSKMVRIVALLALYAHTSSISLQAGWLDTLKDSLSENITLSKKSAAIALCCLGATYVIGKFLWNKYQSYSPKKQVHSQTNPAVAVQKEDPYSFEQLEEIKFSDCNECTKLLIDEKYCDALATKPSDNLIAYSNNDFFSNKSVVTIAEFKNNKLTTKHQLNNFCARSLAFHPTLPILAIGGFKKYSIRLWLYEQKEIITINAHNNTVEKLCWSQDGSLLASASNDGTAKVWSIDQWSIGQETILKCTITPQSHMNDKKINWINTLAFSCDGTYLAIDGINSGITLWQIKNDTAEKIDIKDMPQHDQASKDTFSSLAFHPSDNNQLAIAGENFIALYEIDSQKYTYLYKFDKYFLHPKITYSPLGKYLGLVTSNNPPHYLGMVDLVHKTIKFLPVEMDKATPTWSACTFSPDETSLIWSSNLSEPIEGNSMGIRTFQLSSWRNPFLDN